MQQYRNDDLDEKIKRISERDVLLTKKIEALLERSKAALDKNNSVIRNIDIRHGNIIPLDI